MNRAARLARRLAFAVALVAPPVLFAAPDAVAERAPHARGWLGLEFDSAPSLKPSGARVHHVVRTSPAERAGVRDGDVVLRVDDFAIGGPDELIRKVGLHGPGDAVKLAVARGGHDAPLTMTATLARFPDRDEMLRMDKVGAFAPALDGLTTVSGAVPHGLAELRGRVVVLDFWATWCTACRMATPKLSEWQAKYGAQGLSVLGITDDPVRAVSEGMASFGIRYPVATDESGRTQRAYGVRSLPTVFVIDKRGTIREVAVGFDPGREARLESLIEKLLAEPAPASSAANGP